MKKITRSLARTKYIREVMENPADLGEFRERPTPRLILGLIVMGLSYVMGWPAIFAFGFLAIWFREPWIAAIGPVSYALSCAVFLLGAWIARAPHYLNLLLRYAAGTLFRRLLGVKHS